MNNFQTLNWIGIIDNTFSVYRKYLRLFIAIALIFSIVMWIKGYLSQYFWENNIYDWLSYIIGELLYEWMLGVLVVAATQAYFNKQITIKKAFIQFIQVYPRYLTTQLIYIVPSMLPSVAGEILTEVPIVSLTVYIIAYVLIYLVCIYFLTTWRLYPPAIIVEGNIESSMKLKPLRRSNKLVKNSWWRIFGTLFALKTLLRAIRLVCVVSAVLIIGACGFIENTLEVAEYAIRSETGLFWGYTFPSIKFTTRTLLWGLKIATGIITEPIFASGITLIYFNQQIHREAFDSEMTALQDDTLRPQPK